MTKVEADYEHVQKEGETDITINKYINTVKAMGESTALEYESRLKNFAKYVHEKYHFGTDRLVNELVSEEKEHET